MSGFTPLDAAAMIADRERRFAEGLSWLNGLDAESAALALGRCCDAGRWVAAMVAHRPFPTSWSLFAAARDEWNKCSRRELRKVLGPDGPLGGDDLAEASRAQDKLIRRRLEGLLDAPSGSGAATGGGEDA